MTCLGRLQTVGFEYKPKPIQYQYFYTWSIYFELLIDFFITNLYLLNYVFLTYYSYSLLSNVHAQLYQFRKMWADHVPQVVTLS